jgi:putative flippase GtrA/pimeloyl-ACP methyl ester carboxylesterase
LSAYLRALVVLAATARIPVLSRLVGALTREPRGEATEVSGIPCLVAHPMRPQSRETVVFLNGGTRLGCAHPAVQRLVGGLARAGHVVVAPELPGLKDGVLSLATLEAARTVAREAAPEGTIALFGVSAGASLALLVAADPELEGRISLVVSIAPWADLGAMVELATTGSYRGRPATTTELVRSFVGTSLPRVAPGEAVERLLANRDPAQHARLAAELPPEARDALARLSPLSVAERITASVELVSATDDGYFPLAEAESLAAALPHARLTVTALLDHVRLQPSARDIADVARFWRLTAKTLARTANQSSGGGERSLPTKAAQPLRFMGVGAAGYVATLAFFALLYGGGAPYAAASIAAYLAANALMYLGNRYFTFRLGHDGFWGAYGRYVLVGLLVAGLNASLLAVLVEQAGVCARLGQAISLLLATPVAFVLFRRWTFRVRAA